MGSIGETYPPLRIAILECDTPLPKILGTYGRYGNVFEALLRAGARASRITDPDAGLEISFYQIQETPEVYPDLNDIDAILITGSSESYRVLSCCSWICGLT